MTVVCCHEYENMYSSTTVVMMPPSGPWTQQSSSMWRTHTSRRRRRVEFKLVNKSLLWTFRSLHCLRSTMRFTNIFLSCCCSAQIFLFVLSPLSPFARANQHVIVMAKTICFPEVVRLVSRLHHCLTHF